MKLKDELSGEVFEAELTTDHAASSYGQPVLVINGEALGPLEAAHLEVIEATPEEVDKLFAGAYRLHQAEELLEQAGFVRLPDGNWKPPEI